LRIEKGDHNAKESDKIYLFLESSMLLANPNIFGISISKYNINLIREVKES